jgi:hypothetical protein
MDKYTITLRDGTRWTYAPRSETDIGPWHSDGWRAAHPPCRTPTDFRLCADVVQRWRADHAPKRRRRVVRVGDRYYARHETLDGWMWDFTEDSARAWAKVQTTFGSVPATDEVIDALLSLRDNPNEEVPHGE